MSIEIHNLTYKYPGIESPILRDIDLQIVHGEFVLVTGASGSGKTTLLRCTNGLIPHFYGGSLAGKITVNGKNVLSTPTRELATDVGFIFQHSENQLISATVEREIAFGLENLRLPHNVIKERVQDVLTRFGIENLRDRSPHSLSGGEQQKVTIASVIAMKPSIIIMDEPTANLDPISAVEIIQLTKELNQQLNLTVFIVEHRLEFVLPYCSRIVTLDQGKKVLDLPPEDAFQQQELFAMNIAIPPISILFRQLKDVLNLPGLNIPFAVNEAVTTLQQLVRRKG